MITQIWNQMLKSNLHQSCFWGTKIWLMSDFAWKMAFSRGVYHNLKPCGHSLKVKSCANTKCVHAYRLAVTLEQLLFVWSTRRVSNWLWAFQRRSQMNVDTDQMSWTRFWWMQLGEEKLDGKLCCTDPCIVITTTSLAGIICLGVLIVDLDIWRPSFSARWNAISKLEYRP